MWRLNVAADAAAPATLSVACTAVAHDKDINAVAVAPNDKFIATGSQDKTAKVSLVELLDRVVMELGL